jgi:DNA-binding IclR family transcriptional regulator
MQIAYILGASAERRQPRIAEISVEKSTSWKWRKGAKRETTQYPENDYTAQGVFTGEPCFMIRNRVAGQRAEQMSKKNAKGSAPGEHTGTQSIERAVGLLREISARGHFGWQLSDLADRCSLSKGTTHRMLMCLVRERLVKQRPSDRHYLPGPMLFELGLSLPELGALQNKAKSWLAALAKRRPSAAFLFFRSGDDFVCAEREGSTDLKALTIMPGTRRPLATSAGGAAMLLDLPVPEARATARRNLASLAGYDRERLRAIRSMLERTNAERFAINAGDLLPGVNEYGLALRDAEGEPFASIVLAGLERALPVSQLPEIRGWLQATVEALQEKRP